MTAAASKRVHRVLHLVDELELDADELRALRAELDARQECELNLAACNTAEERELALTIKRRIEAHARGEVELVPVGDIMKRAREELRRVQISRRRATSR